MKKSKIISSKWVNSGSLLPNSKCDWKNLFASYMQQNHLQLILMNCDTTSSAREKVKLNHTSYLHAKTVCKNKSCVPIIKLEFGKDALRMTLHTPSPVGNEWKIEEDQLAYDWMDGCPSSSGSLGPFGM